MSASGSPSPPQSNFYTTVRPRPPAPTGQLEATLSSINVNSTTHLVEREAGAQSPVDWPDYYWNDSPSQSLTAEQRKTTPSGIFYGWRTVVFGSWLNLLLVLLPVAWVISVTMKTYHRLIFILCILALIPLVKLHDLSTRDLAIRIGGTKTGLVNASMSNIVEIVVAISALRKCELQVVQAAMVGSILSKLLLILGLCFLAGGMRFSEQGFDATATQIHSSLLNISVGAILIPIAYHFTLGSSSQDPTSEQARDILHMSHGVSLVLLIIYGAYLLFQLWSHTHLYHDEHNKKSNRLSVKLPLEKPAIFRSAKRRANGVDSPNKDKFPNESSPIGPSLPQRPYLQRPTLPSELTLANTDQDINTHLTSVRVVGGSGIPVQRYNSYYDELRGSTHLHDRATPTLERDQDSAQPASSRTTQSTLKEPRLSWALTCTLLIIVTVAVAITADWLVGSLDGISMHISKPWVGLILLPVVSSIAECITAINVSVKDQLTLSVSVAIGSALQTALFCIPSMVILAWIIDKPLSLLMDPFQSLVTYLVQTAGYVIADGKSNWLEGMILLCLYVIVGVAFWFYPGIQLPAALSECHA
ncbi:hypothetical protein AX15_004583 [Amanita polypyramis BW_CC]|nr:hypothetical protein AX15_004583 [Amanita polypyramis BW_CC]